ncbi:LuxR C-terminal-related transcriptional regulator [Pseudoalteromonas ruthenica]|uniref:HTH luxR-type domain-containing protein n=1 Tax=Pseudoalteromonas ruthenica TaxID=151081 RepID=A0A0F4PN24_9GAMM|nr:LuxR C-terminal-related transcriptional regulator [Pseudoalteromonas ruthenica]KJY96021.1 hypothetical protein TW76_12610 [Pseudoalteromonas ruthenica]KJY96827.1 hypothetical protein TW72_16600 [Pseudoalteromonas ruthenica]
MTSAHVKDTTTQLISSYPQFNTLLLDYQVISDLVDPTSVTRFMHQNKLKHLVIASVPSDMNFGHLKRWPNLRGVFIAPSTDEQVMQGLQAIAEGKLWFPRKVTDHWMRHYLATEEHQQSQKSLLTEKEMTVLKLLASGMPLISIAERLFISDATVRVHLHKIYQKIGVKNKQQAMLWSQQHLT